VVRPAAAGAAGRRRHGDSRRHPRRGGPAGRGALGTQTSGARAGGGSVENDQALAAFALDVLVVDGALGALLGALAEEAAGDGVAADAAGTVDFDDERASVR